MFSETFARHPTNSCQVFFWILRRPCLGKAFRSKLITSAFLPNLFLHSLLATCRNVLGHSYNVLLFVDLMTTAPTPSPSVTTFPLTPAVPARPPSTATSSPPKSTRPDFDPNCFELLSTLAETQERRGLLPLWTLPPPILHGMISLKISRPPLTIFYKRFRKRTAPYQENIQLQRRGLTKQIRILKDQAPTFPKPRSKSSCGRMSFAWSTKGAEHWQNECGHVGKTTLSTNSNTSVRIVRPTFPTAFVGPSLKIRSASPSISTTVSPHPSVRFRPAILPFQTRAHGRNANGINRFRGRSASNGRRQAPATSRRQPHNRCNCGLVCGPTDHFSGSTLERFS